MSQSYRIKSPTPLLAKPAVIVVLFVVSCVAVYSVFQMYGKYRRAAQVRNRARDEYHELENKRTVLEESTERLNTERGQEEELRTRYQAVRPGEQLIVIVDPMTSPGISPQKVFWWDRVWQKIVQLFSV